MCLTCVFFVSKPITVEKLVPLDFDINLLSAFDTNALDEKVFK
jgi:regulator of ribosome biosynthesis